MAISPGVYRISNASTKTLFDQSGPSNNIIHGWAQNDSGDQQWFVQLSGGGVVLKNVEFGQYAYATNFQNGGRVFASNNLITWDLSQDEDEWTISLPGTNYVIEIDNANEANGGSIILWENLGLKHQRWILEKISNGQPQQLQEQQSIPQEYSSKPLEKIFQPPEPFAVSPGIYYLRNVMSGTLITLYGGSTDEGAEISGYEYSGGNQQKWQLQSTGHGQNMTIRNVQTNTYLWFRGQSFIPSFPAKSSYRPQAYVITAANRGFCISPAQQPSYALSLLHGSGQDRTEIAIWHNDQQDNQKWYFEHA